jgi:hypothetical protein
VWGIENFGMGDNGQEFVDARPGDHPGRPAFGQFSDQLASRFVPGSIFAMRIDGKVRIQGLRDGD